MASWRFESLRGIIVGAAQSVERRVERAESVGEFRVAEVVEKADVGDT